MSCQNDMINRKLLNFIIQYFTFPKIRKTLIAQHIFATWLRLQSRICSSRIDIIALIFAIASVTFETIFWENIHVTIVVIAHSKLLRWIVIPLIVKFCAAKSLRITFSIDSFKATFSIIILTNKFFQCCISRAIDIMFAIANGTQLKVLCITICKFAWLACVRITFACGFLFCIQFSHASALQIISFLTDEK